MEQLTSTCSTAAHASARAIASSLLLMAWWSYIAIGRRMQNQGCLSPSKGAVSCPVLRPGPTPCNMRLAYTTSNATGERYCWLGSV